MGINPYISVLIALKSCQLLTMDFVASVVFRLLQMLQPIPVATASQIRRHTGLQELLLNMKAALRR